MISQNGLIVPGNWNHGILRYKDRLFAFANEENAQNFAAEPEKVIEGVLKCARSSASLVQLLQLYGHFPSIEALENAKSFTRQQLLGAKPLGCEVGTQSDLHILDKHIDPNYEWNEWAMRRRGLMLLNLRNKVTHSTQTRTSHFRQDAQTQHYAPKYGYICLISLLTAFECEK